MKSRFFVSTFLVVSALCAGLAAYSEKDHSGLKAKSGLVLTKKIRFNYFALFNHSDVQIKLTPPGVGTSPIVLSNGGKEKKNRVWADPPTFQTVNPGEAGFWISNIHEITFLADRSISSLLSFKWIYDEGLSNVQSNSVALLLPPKVPLIAGENTSFNVDKPKSEAPDPADAPDPTPTPVPLAKMLPVPTGKGFSQTIAAVVDAPQADIAFLLLNGDKEFTPMPLDLHHPGNNFSVTTPSGKVVEDGMDKMQPRLDMKVFKLKPRQLKIWKVNIKAWFDAHKLTAPGFYSLTWTCEGQKSEPFNLYIPTPEEKARLDKEAAQNR